MKPGYGSFLTLEFGSPYLDVREPIIANKNASLRVRRHLARRCVFVHGEWHLWIYDCAWEIISGHKRVGNDSTRSGVQRAADLLDGQKLTRFSLVPKELRCVFDFDLGATLQTVPNNKKGEQWILYTPNKKVLSLRADGRYQYMRSDQTGDKGQWKPISN